jgi:hypothetical protein
VADEGDQLALGFHFQAQHAETVLLVVKGDTFNEAGKAFEFAEGGLVVGSSDMAKWRSAGRALR